MCFVVNKQEIFKQIHLYSVLQGVSTIASTIVSTIVPELYSSQKKNAYYIYIYQHFYLTRRLTSLKNGSNFKTTLKTHFSFIF